MAIKNLRFVDTNIWLDFYRARKDAGLALLAHAEAVADRIIVTYQLETEFKKNRQPEAGEPADRCREARERTHLRAAGASD